MLSFELGGIATECEICSMEDGEWHGGNERDHCRRQ